jgi:hypothetical protein
MPSTRDLSSLVQPSELERLVGSLAVLDLVLEEDEYLRWHLLETRASRRVGILRNGQGEQMYLISDGPHPRIVIHGFDHESDLSPCDQPPFDPKLYVPWPGIFDTIPPWALALLTEYERAIGELAFFAVARVTFCVWSTPEGWKCGPVKLPEGEDPDGSAYLLAHFDGVPETYRKWAEDYFERSIPIEAVSAIYGHEPLTPALVAALNPERNPEAALREAASLGYP